MPLNPESCAITVRPIAGMLEPSGMTLDLTRNLRVGETFNERNGPWQALMQEFSDQLF
jgi:hypothetical protein